jgi:hypothetical protein
MAENKHFRVHGVRLIAGLAVTAVLFGLPAFAAKPVEKIEYEPDWDPDKPPPGYEKVPWDQESAKKYGDGVADSTTAIGPVGLPILDGITWVVAAKGYTIRLTQLDAEMRWKYIQAMTGAVTDPFANTDPDSPGFLTFALELESATDGHLVLEAQRCRLISNKYDFLHPLDIPTIEAAYNIQDSSPPPAYRQVKGALVDGEVILRNGDSGSGLLIYKGIDSKAKTFVVEVVLTTPAGEAEDYKLPYRRVVPDKKKKKKKK